MSPLNLPPAVPLFPLATVFSQFIHYVVFAVRHVTAIFLSNVGEGSELIVVVVVNQKFNREPVCFGRAAFAHVPYAFQGSEVRLGIGSLDHGGIIVPTV